VVGLRDRALVGLLVYSFARVSATIAMNVRDYYPSGKKWWLRLHEKGGKHHERPAHHELEEWLNAYLDAARIREDKKGPLFRTAAGRTGELTEERLTRQDVRRMIKRRAKDAGIQTRSAAIPGAPPASPPTSPTAASSRKPSAWPRTRARAPPSSMTAGPTASPSMRSNGIVIR
jgi:integrase